MRETERGGRLVRDTAKAISFCCIIAIPERTIQSLEDDLVEARICSAGQEAVELQRTVSLPFRRFSAKFRQTFTRSKRYGSLLAGFCLLPRRTW